MLEAQESPTLQRVRSTGIWMMCDSDRSAQRRNPASPACLSAVRALLSFHWAQWSSITEAGGRACALSAAIATACREQTRAAEGRAAVARARAGAQGGDMASSQRITLDQWKKKAAKVELNDTQKQEIKEAFDLFDIDGSISCYIIDAV